VRPPNFSLSASQHFRAAFQLFSLSAFQKFQLSAFQLFSFSELHFSFSAFQHFSISEDEAIGRIEIED